MALINKKWLRYAKFYFTAARIAADLTYAKKRKVGCIIVQDGNILSFGFNGTPSGEDNNCEDEDGKTLPSVIHAEVNALNKLSKIDFSREDNIDIFVTCEPCYNCAIVIANYFEYHRTKPSVSVFFLEQSKRYPGVGSDILKRAGVHAQQMFTDNNGNVYETLPLDLPKPPGDGKEERSVVAGCAGGLGCRYEPCCPGGIGCKGLFTGKLPEGGTIEPCCYGNNCQC